MKLLTELLKLNENKIIDRRVLRLFEKALKPLGRGIKLTRVEEFTGRNGTVEGEGNYEKMPNRGAIKKAEDTLEDLAFDEFVQGPDFAGQTVSGVEFEFGKSGSKHGPLEGEFTFVIEFMDR